MVVFLVEDLRKEFEGYKKSGTGFRCDFEAVLVISRDTKDDLRVFRIY